MEVSGRIDNRDHVACKPCKDQGFFKCSDGFCGECDEYLCQSCFDTHIKWKPCRGHTFTDPAQRAKKHENNADLEKCNKHLKELVKFYCPQHEQIGCGDCMILDHKACKVEYIPDRASSFKDSREFTELTEGAKKCHSELKEMLTSIEGNKKQITDNNQQFVHDVNMFREEIFAHVNKLTNAMLKQGEDIRGTDLNNIVKLEKECKSLMTELSLLKEEVDSHIDKPAKLFVNSIIQKPTLQRLRDEINSFRDKNKIEIYEFKRNGGIGKSIKECNEFGSIQKLMHCTKIDVREDTRPKAQPRQPLLAQAPVKPQPLLERQLICRNMNVDGEYLSYAVNGSGDVGTYVDKNRINRSDYYEVQILSNGKVGTIVIGIVPENYPENILPGYGPGSIGYNAGDGLLYYGNCSGEEFGPKYVKGDRIGCGLTRVQGHFVVVFTRNGSKIGQRGFYWANHFPAVGMRVLGERVKVILNANMPKFD